MVGLLGCGCCVRDPGDPPIGCTTCQRPTIYTGILTVSDKEPFHDTFDTINPYWHLHHAIDDRYSPYVPPAPPNSISDYQRKGRLYAFREGWLNYMVGQWFADGYGNPVLYWEYMTTIPPQPVPNNEFGRQPTVYVRRFCDLHFPEGVNRTYKWEIEVNYPKTGLAATQNAYQDSMTYYHGVSMVFDIGVLYSAKYAAHTFSMYGRNFSFWDTPMIILDKDTLNHPNAYLESSTPYGSKRLDWGLHRFRFELSMTGTGLPSNKVFVGKYFIDDVLIGTATHLDQNPNNPIGLFNLRRRNTSSCVSVCNVPVNVAAYEHFKFKDQGFGWVNLSAVSFGTQKTWRRGYVPDAIPPRMNTFDYGHYWVGMKAEDELWFDNYKWSYVDAITPEPGP